MAEFSTRDVEYHHDGTRMIGLVCAPGSVSEVSAGLPGVLLLHDAFGLGEDAIAIARRIASLGFAVFAADVWGERALPASEAEIGPLIGDMVRDHRRWIARIAAAREAAAAQPEIADDRIVALGYCFGGSSALEYLRTGGRLLGVAAVHPGLDLVEYDWSGTASTPGTAVLVCLGADDPMATPDQWRQTKAGMTAAGIDWELDLYSGTVHGFTSPKAARSPNPAAIMYHPRNAERAWHSTARFLREILAEETTGAPAAGAGEASPAA